MLVHWSLLSATLPKIARFAESQLKFSCSAGFAWYQNRWPKFCAISWSLVLFPSVGASKDCKGRIKWPLKTHLWTWNPRNLSLLRGPLYFRSVSFGGQGRETCGKWKEILSRRSGWEGWPTSFLVAQFLAAGGIFVALLHKVGLKNKKSCCLKIKKIISLIVFTRGLGGTFF